MLILSFQTGFMSKIKAEISVIFITNRNFIK